MPGIAASTRLTWLFGAPPNSVEAPEKSLALEVTWAWTSMPTTTSQSPVAPLRSFDFGAALTASVIQIRPFCCNGHPTIGADGQVSAFGETCPSLAMAI